MLDSPAVRTLSRYLVARFVQLYVVVAIVAVLSVLVVELLLNLDRMMEFGDGPGGALRYLWLRLAAEYASYIVPLAAFLAAFSTAALAAYTHEWMALKAGGIALVRFALPLVGCGAALSVGAALLHETVIIGARQEWNRQRDGDANIRFQEGAFWYQRGGRIFRVAEADREDRTLRDVRIFERDDRGRLRRSVTARRIEILDAERWLFIDAVFREFDPADRSAPPRIEHSERRVLEIADPRDRALMQADPAALSLARMREFIAAKEARGVSADRQWTVLYGRLGDWASITLLVAAAVPLGLGVERTRSLGRSASYATAAIAGFYALRNVSEILSLQGLAPPGVAVLCVLAVLAGLAALAIKRAPR